MNRLADPLTFMLFMTLVFTIPSCNRSNEAFADLERGKIIRGVIRF